MKRYLTLMNIYYVGLSRINRLILATWIILQMPISLAAAAPTRPTIDVGIMAGGWGAFQQWDGQAPSGFSVDLMLLLAARLDYQVVWHVYPSWRKMYQDACRGKVDILLDAFNTDTRPCISFSLPYYTSPTVVVVRQDSALFQDVSRLPQASVAIEKGFLTEKLIRLHYPNVSPLLVVDTHSALMAVEQREADAYIGNLHVVNLFIKNHPGLVVVAQSPLLMETLHLGVNRNKPGLAIRLNTAIQSLAVEERSALEQRWLGESISPQFMGHSGFLLRPDERTWLSTLPPMKLGLIPGWSPFSMQDKEGVWSGLIADYLSLLREKLGLAYHNVSVKSWPDLQQLLLHHEIDMTVLPVRIVERLAGWHGSTIFTAFPMVLVTARGSIPIGDLSDLAGKKLLLTDSMLLPQLRTLVPDLKLITTKSASEGLAHVAAGEGDAYIGNLVVVSRLVTEQFDDRLHIAAPTPFKDELVVAVREPYVPLLPLVNRVLASMSDKEKRQIRNSWLALNYSEGIPRAKLVRTLLPAGGAITLFILVLSVAYWRLRQEIVRRHQVEAALARAKTKAESAAIQKGEFLATLMGGEIRLESAPGLGTFISLTVTLPVLAQREPDPRLNGVQAHIDLHDEKLCHTLLLQLDALGVTRTSESGDAQLRFTDHELVGNGVIRVLPLATPLGYRGDEEGYILNSNPMTWHAVREVCYRQLGLSDGTATKAMRKSAPMQPCRVLLVEDNPLNQSLVIRQLRQLGMNCDVAEHGQQALEMVAQHPYELVLCDCQMPVMDGYEFTRRIRAAEKGERQLIIAMTANVLPEQAERCFAAGMDDLLGKPVLLETLRQMLQKWQILPAPTLIDVAAMEAFFGQGDKLRQMFPLFRQELEQAMVQQPQDDKALANWVHRQAGTISMMMAPQLAEEAWRLEEKIRQLGSSSCADELTGFRAQLQQIIGELRGLSERYEESVVVEGELK